MQEILDWIHHQGYSPIEKIIIDGQVHRFTHVAHSRDNIGYCFYEHGGWLHDHVKGETFKWVAKGIKSDPVLRDKIKQQQKDTEDKLRQLKKDAAKGSRELWERCIPAKPDHPYLIRKKIKPYGIRQDGNKLIIPVQDDKGIKSIQSIDDEGDKLFLKGGEVKGGYHILSNDDDDYSTIIICEGYATAATIREATDKPVVMAFFASNLPPVAKYFQKEYPSSKIIIAADNDKNNKVNAGIEAASKCTGCEIRPVQFDKGTDYNDLALVGGLPAVIEQLFPAPVNQDVFGYEPPPESVYGNEQPFRVLGFNDGIYYYYPESTQQIIELQPAAHTAANLLQLARYKYWYDGYAEGKGDNKKIDYTKVADVLMEESHQRGIFNPAKQIRCRGVWMEDDSPVFNSGEHLYINGVTCAPLNSLRNSRYIYVRAERLPPPLEPCTNQQAYRFREICEMASWQNKVSGTLLAGWCVVSLVSGALNWRPHIWLTGESGSGKTTILKEIISTILGEMALNVDGGTTEAAIRQTLGGDSLPIIYDEAESESEKDKITMEGVLLLARKASSGAALIKGGQTGKPSYHYCKSTFCFSCINPSMRKFADERRVVMLELKKSTDDVNYQVFLDAIRETLTPEFGRRLLGRAITYLPALLKNGQTFVDAATQVLGDRAAADQIGNILAGVYLLHSTKEVSPEAALNFLKEHDLRSYTTIDEHKDAERLLSFISSRRYRVNQNHEYYIGQMIAAWYAPTSEGFGIGKEAIENALRQLGIWPKENGVWMSNNSPWLDDALKNTHWSKWRVLGRLMGVEQCNAVSYAPGQKASRGIIIPKTYFLTDQTKGE